MPKGDALSPVQGTTSSTSGLTSSVSPQLKIGKRYRLVRRLGAGAFGEVFVGVDLVTEEYVAVKLEPLVSAHQPHLYHEARLYQYLHRGVVTVGIPRVRYYAREGDFNVMIMDLLGPSLEDMFDFCGRRFGVKTVCMLGVQMIQRLQFMHAMGFLHRDLKPENFVMGIGRRAHHVYLIDMGLAKRYRDLQTGAHIPYIEGKALTGTARYVSINTHLGKQQSRRDDLESLGYILVYFAAGGLPWQGVRCNNKLEKYEQIKTAKVSTRAEQLCRHISCPGPFVRYLQYCRSLKFDEEPNYRACVSMWTDLMSEMDWEMDYRFQWLNSDPTKDEFESGNMDARTDRVVSPASMHPSANRSKPENSHHHHHQSGRGAAQSPPPPPQADPEAAPRLSSSSTSISANFDADEYQTAAAASGSEVSRASFLSPDDPQAPRTSSPTGMASVLMRRSHRTSEMSSRIAAPTTPGVEEVDDVATVNLQAVLEQELM